MAATSTIYLLHFEPAYIAKGLRRGKPMRVSHYLGSTSKTPHERLAEHIRGLGSPLVRAAVAQGCIVHVAASWPGGRDEERQAKRGHHHGRQCPLCRRGRESL